MAWIVVPKTYLVTRGKCDVVMAMDSVEMLMFSVDSDCVSVKIYRRKNTIKWIIIPGC